ncbi:MAG: hypothetical protein KBC78_00865 [Candidatus Pacebacteria bacterium]|nr:hypothetical protein [Candidatus Paceibacterota bacterium]
MLSKKTSSQELVGDNLGPIIDLEFTLFKVYYSRQLIESIYSLCKDLSDRLAIEGVKDSYRLDFIGLDKDLLLLLNDSNTSSLKIIQELKKRLIDFESPFLVNGHLELIESKNIYIGSSACYICSSSVYTSFSKKEGQHQRLQRINPLSLPSIYNTDNNTLYYMVDRVVIDKYRSGEVYFTGTRYFVSNNEYSVSHLTDYQKTLKAEIQKD